MSNFSGAVSNTGITTPSFRKYDIAELSRGLCQHLPELIEKLDLPLKPYGNCYQGPCCLHNGNNKGALNIYPTGNTKPGYWQCWTKNCQEHFKDSILGFLRGVLSNKYYDWALSGRVYSWNDTLKWAQLFLEGRPIEIEKAVTQEKLLGGIPKDLIKFRLKIPALTLIKRGFSSDVLIRYSVGTCEDCKKPMYRREVVPIYDQLYRECVGCTGRSVFDECKRCGAFHSEMMPCSLINKKVYTKWKHSKGFKKGQHLYNSWFALPHIKKTDSCILVEGPLDVLKLEMAGIRNGLATFGARISDQQQIILESWSISRVVCLFDNDEAGVKGREQVRKKLKKSHKLVFPEFVGHDVGELTIEQVKGIRYG